MELARAWRPQDPEVAAVWLLLLYAFEHQGRPSNNLDLIIQMFEGTTRTAGWDEFGIDDTSDPARILVYFIRDEAECNRASALAELKALRSAARSG